MALSLSATVFFFEQRQQISFSPGLDIGPPLGVDEKKFALGGEPQKEDSPRKKTLPSVFFLFRKKTRCPSFFLRRKKTTLARASSL